MTKVEVRSPQSTSLLWQLEAVRGAAACYVAAGHIWREPLNQFKSGLGDVLAFGQEVVITFFLLSGFVIHWSVAQKKSVDFRHYLRDRALRIYPLYLLTLLIALVFAKLHGSTDPRTSWGTLLGNIFMLQDWGAIKPGVWVEVYAGVLVLWSLSYEWWFYMLYYPLSKKLAPRFQAGIVALVSVSQAIVYLWSPNQASRFLIYFCIWWTGVELARAKLARQPINLHAIRWSFATLLLVTGILSYGWWSAHRAGAFLLAGTHPILEVRHFCAAIFILLGALLWHTLRWRGFRLLFGGFIFMAPSSYALYLLHEPINEELGRLNLFANPLLRIGITSLVAILAAWLAENYLQKMCRQIFKK